MLQNFKSRTVNATLPNEVVDKPFADSGFLDIEEIWKDIEGYEGSYQVSNLGRVKSIERVVKGKRTGHKKIEEHILTPPIVRGYCRVTLANSGKNRKVFSVHRLVAIAFIPNPENKKTVNHKNGIRNDNRLENLEWATYSENCKHGFKELGRNPRRGSLDNRSIPVYCYTDDWVLIKSYESEMEAQRDGHTRASIRYCISKKKQHHHGMRWSRELIVRNE